MSEGYYTKFSCKMPKNDHINLATITRVDSMMNDIESTSGHVE